MEKLIPSPVTSIEEQATGQVPVSRMFVDAVNVLNPKSVYRKESLREFIQKSYFINPIVADDKTTITTTVKK